MSLNGKPLNDASVDTSSLLSVGLKHKPNDLAIVSTSCQWTWLELDTAIHNLAVNLLNLGLVSGDRIASLMPNRSALLIHYLACLRAGLVAVPLNYRYMSPEVDYALEVSGAKLLVTHGERSQDLASSQIVSALPLGVMYYERGDGNTNVFQRLIQSVQTVKPLPNHQPTAPALIFFTSGSTDRPKGVTHSHASIAHMLAKTAAALEMAPDDVMLPGSSFSHIGAFRYSLMALSKGAKVIVARNYHDDEMLELLRQQKPTVMSMLPAGLFHLVRDQGSLKDDFNSLRLCLTAGDHVSAELEQEFTSLTSLAINEGYAMTEVGLLTMSPISNPVKVGSVGCPVPGVSLSIRDDAYQELSCHQTGRLWAKTDSATIGYWNNPVATQELFHDGWLDTGDLMESDRDGYLYFRGRKKQIIVHDGSNISPQEVEEVLLGHPAVETVGVVGVHDLIHGENVRAYVTLKAEVPSPTALELIRFAYDRIGYKAPEEIEFLEKMPLNATGKIDRALLKQLATERHNS